eukprot:15441630-Alexandrium_andersonii.AAC.1
MSYAASSSCQQVFYIAGAPLACLGRASPRPAYGGRMAVEGVCFPRFELSLGVVLGGIGAEQ